MVFNQSAALNLSRSGIDLADGYPRLGTPPYMRELFFEEMSRPWRGDADAPYGILSLREAVSDEVCHAQGLRVDPTKHVTIAGSASEALTASLLAVVKRRTGVAIFSPHFPVYATAVEIAGARPCYVPMSLDGALDIDAFQHLLAAIDISAVIINTPHNPTGAVLSGADCSRIMTLCRDAAATVIADEVFAHLVPPGMHLSPAAVDDCHVPIITISDSGKKFDFGGLRLGYIIANEELTGDVRTIQQTMTYRVSVPLQHAVAAGLRWATSGYYEELRATIAANADSLTRALRVGLSAQAWINSPAAGCFLLAAIPGQSGHELATQIADRAKVLTLPGVAFADGRERTPMDNFVRFSLARERGLIDEAAGRLREMAADGMR